MKERVFGSLQFKIIIFSILIVLGSLLILGYRSYAISHKIITNKVSSYNLKNVIQIGRNIEFVLENIHEMSLNMFQSEEVITFLKLDSYEKNDEYIQSKFALKNYMNALLAFNGNIDSVYLKSNNDEIYFTPNNKTQMDPDLIKSVHELKGMYQWMPNTVADGSNVFSLMRDIYDTKRLSDNLGIVSINIKESIIKNIYAQSLFNKEEAYYILNDNYHILSSISNNDDFVPSIKENLQVSKQEGFKEISIKNEKYLVTYYQIDYTDWTLVNVVPIAVLIKGNEVILQTLVTSIVGSLIICIFIFFFFYRKIFSPLKQVRRLMGELEKENFDLYFNIKAKDEIGLLGESFNKMSKQLKEVRNQVYLSKIKQREAELISLEAQINPHFLYNTLDTAYWMTRMEKAYESSNIIQSLAQMFRLSLNNGFKDITVRKEVDHLKHYLTIQKIRYKGVIDFYIEVNEEVMDCKVTKLILQPLVENAILHGLEEQDSKGYIIINIYNQGDILYYEIKDDGVGADIGYLNGLLECETSGDGFAIKNINDRIKLYSGDDYGLKFYNNKPSGIKAIVTQKYRLN